MKALYTMGSIAGLVICGGNSSRMGTDKSIIDYHGLPQRQYVFNLLKYFCETVYLSINSLMMKYSDDSFLFIEDDPQFAGIGPMAALLSFWKKYPDSAVLAVGCDYPFVDKVNLQKLTEHRGGGATCFINPEKNICEPFITIYESSFHKIALNNFNNKKYSLSKILETENKNTVEPTSGLVLLNVNTIEEYSSVKELIKQKAI